MSDAWPIVKLAEFLNQIEDVIVIDDGTEYCQITVRMHNRGLVLRQKCIGKDIKTKNNIVFDQVNLYFHESMPETALWGSYQLSLMARL